MGLFHQQFSSVITESIVAPRLIDNVSKRYSIDRADALDIITLFNTQKAKLSNRDILSYQTIDELRSSIDEAAARKSRSNIKLSGSIKVYEDDQIIVVAPLTPNTCQLYGRNTKWCIAGKSTYAFYTYTLLLDVDIYMIIEKTTDKKVSVTYARNDRLMSSDVEFDEDEQRLADLLETEKLNGVVVWSDTDKVLKAFPGSNSNIGFFARGREAVAAGGIDIPIQRWIQVSKAIIHTQIPARDYLANISLGSPDVFAIYYLTIFNKITPTAKQSISVLESDEMPTYEKRIFATHIIIKRAAGEVPSKLLFKYASTNIKHRYDPATEK